MKNIDIDSNKFGSIKNKDVLVKNLRMNCVPVEIQDMDIEDYENFLNRRRKLMAKKIREYYYSL